MKPDDTKPLQPREIIQITPPHKWAPCLAVVDKPKPFGCQAYVCGPVHEGAGTFYIRLEWDDFERVGASVMFEPVI